MIYRFIYLTTYRYIYKHNMHRVNPIYDVRILCLIAHLLLAMSTAVPCRYLVSSSRGKRVSTQPCDATGRAHCASAFTRFCYSQYCMV